MGFFRFMASKAGRATRVVGGLVLIVLGAVIGGAGWILAVVGLVPLLAGAFDVCVFAPLMRKPFSGDELRAAVAEDQ
ncbi:MAG: DUF2892 domain-containing protein [Acidimicrobiia bacterium]|nr:DUF2892 domain-containing protein [Acidimicrobiia bacterium]